MDKLMPNDNLIDINDNMLSIKDLLKSINYEFNNLYIDKFWDHIKDDKWIYIDSEMLLWIGYNCNEIKNNKKIYILLLKDHFEDDLDYKIINYKEFNEFSQGNLQSLDKYEMNVGNKTKHLLVSPDCFKQSLMLLKTSKSKEIKKYYIELKKILY